MGDEYSGYRPDIGNQRVRKSTVEQLDDRIVVVVKIVYQGVLCFQHDTESIESIRGVDTQQPCISLLQGHADVGTYAIK